MSYIIEGVYLGDVSDAWKSEKLKDQGITHLLTIDGIPLPLEFRDGFEYKYVHALDLGETDVLSHLPEVIEFIESGRQAGGILVHCHAGMSRSATLVIAYVMKKLEMGLQDAFDLVKCSKGDIRPNAGFMEQLAMFEDMGCKLDRSHQSYKLYKLKNLSIQIQSARLVEGHIKDSLTADPSLAHIAGEIIFKCKKCRRALFRQSGILKHEEGKGEQTFSQGAHGITQGRPSDGKSESLCGRSLFIEPVQWMENTIHQINGKISCPKCSAKLGSFNWVGERCPCGTWVTPAFHIQTGKVDETRPRVITPNLPVRGPAQVTEVSKTKEGATDSVNKELPMFDMKDSPSADLTCDIDQLSLDDT